MEVLEGNFRDTDIIFSRVGPDLPLLPPDLQTNFSTIPTQALAVSNQFGLTFFTHPTGFCVMRTTDLVQLVQESRNSHKDGLNAQGRSLATVTLPDLHIVALSKDELTIAACAGNTVYFFDIPTLVHKGDTLFLESKSFEEEACMIKQFIWNMDKGTSFAMLSSEGTLTSGEIGVGLECIAKGVVAADWSPDGQHMGYLTKDNHLHIIGSDSSKFELPLQMVGTDLNDGPKIHVDTLRWVRLDSILVSCVQELEDDQDAECSFFLLTSEKGDIVKEHKEIVYSKWLFPSIDSSIVHNGSGPDMLVAYLSPWEVAVVTNRSSTDAHIVLVGWLQEDGKTKAFYLDLVDDRHFPRIELQGSGDDNTVVGLDIDKTTVSIQLPVPGDESGEKLPPCPLLICITIEGKMSLFSFARTNKNWNNVQIVSPPLELPKRQLALLVPELEDRPCEDSHFNGALTNFVKGSQIESEAAISDEVQIVDKQSRERKVEQLKSEPEEILKVLNRGTKEQEGKSDQEDKLNAPNREIKVKQLMSEQEGKFVAGAQKPEQAEKLPAAALNLTDAGSTIHLNDQDLVKDSQIKNNTAGSDEVQIVNKPSGERKLEQLKYEAEEGLKALTRETKEREGKSDQENKLNAPNRETTVKQLMSEQEEMLVTAAQMPEQAEKLAAAALNLTDARSVIHLNYQELVKGSQIEGEAAVSDAVQILDMPSRERKVENLKAEPEEILMALNRETTKSSASSDDLSIGYPIISKGISTQFNFPQALKANPQPALTSLEAVSALPQIQTVSTTSSSSVKSSFPGSGHHQGNNEKANTLQTSSRLESSMILASSSSGSAPADTFAAFTTRLATSSMQRTPDIMMKPFGILPEQKLQVHSSHMSEMEADFMRELDKVRSMAKEVDDLMAYIEGISSGGKGDQKRTFTKLLLDDNEKGIYKLSADCKKLRGRFEEQMGSIEDLQDESMQVDAWRIYVHSLVEQAADSRYQALWNRQKLHPEMNIRRKRILKADQVLKQHIGELEGHLHNLELSQFGKAQSHSKKHPNTSLQVARKSQSLQSLYETINAQMAVAEQLAEYLAQQMESLKISPSLTSSVPKSLSLALEDKVAQNPLTNMTRFESPCNKQMDFFPSQESKVYGLQTPAKLDMVGGAGMCLQDSTRRRRDSMDRSWVGMGAAKTTVKRAPPSGQIKRPASTNWQPKETESARLRLSLGYAQANHFMHNDQVTDRCKYGAAAAYNKFTTGHEEVQAVHAGIFGNTGSGFGSSKPLNHQGDANPVRKTTKTETTEALKLSSSGVLKHGSSNIGSSIGHPALFSSSQTEKSRWGPGNKEEKPAKSPPVLTTGILPTSKPTSKVGLQTRVTETQVEASNSESSKISVLNIHQQSAETSRGVATELAADARSSPGSGLSSSVQPTLSLEASSFNAFKISHAPSTKKEVGGVHKLEPLLPAMIDGAKLDTRPTSISFGATTLVPDTQIHVKQQHTLDPASVSTSGSPGQVSHPVSIQFSPPNMPVSIPRSQEVTSTFSIMPTFDSKTSSVFSTSAGQPLGSTSGFLSSSSIPLYETAIDSTSSPSSASASHFGSANAVPPLKSASSLASPFQNVSATSSASLFASPGPLINSSKSLFGSAGASASSSVSAFGSASALPSSPPSPFVSSATSLFGATSPFGSTNSASSSTSVFGAASTPSTSTSFGQGFMSSQLQSFSTSGSSVSSSSFSFSGPLTAGNEEDMEEEASTATELSFGGLGGFGLGSSVPSTNIQVANPFGGSLFGSTNSPSVLNVPSGQLFRPAAFSLPAAQSSPQQSSAALFGSGGLNSGGSGFGSPSQPTSSAFGQRTQPGAGQQALGSALGAFGQTRQLGAGFGSSFGIGGRGTGTSLAGATDGFASAATGAGFAAVPTGGGFAGLNSGGGFAGISSGGGFGGVGTGGGFQPFSGSQGGFGAFGAGSSGLAGNSASSLFTQMRK